MAKNRRSGIAHSNTIASEADTLFDVDSLVSPSLTLPTVYDDPLRSELIQIEDRRLFDPEADYRSASFISSPAPRLIPTRSFASGLPASISWDRPDNVAVCIRRKERREVMFAKRKAKGRGGPRRRNWWSNVRC